MILTASEIAASRGRGEIVIAPFNAAQLNPCSYTYRLGPELGVPVVDGDNVRFDTITIPPEGYVLQPGRMYLGHTQEVMGSHHYAMSLIGRSGLGRLGLFLQVTANLIHVGALHQITLELVVAKPLRLYAGMPIGEISFWEVLGKAAHYSGGYAMHNAPTQSRLMER